MYQGNSPHPSSLSHAPTSRPLAGGGNDMRVRIKTVASPPPNPKNGVTAEEEEEEEEEV